MIDSTIGEDMAIAGGKDMILAGRYHSAGIQPFNHVKVRFF